MRVGVTEVFLCMFATLGATWIERNADKIVRNLFDVLSAAKVSVSPLTCNALSQRRARRRSLS